MKSTFLFIACLIFYISCKQAKPENTPGIAKPAVADTMQLQPVLEVVEDVPSKIKAALPTANDANKIETKNVTPAQLITFAKSLIGTPYRFGSANPVQGFDCSGFIYYVFNHFNIQVPRSSIEFTNVPTEIPLKQARPGDLILFTGTNNSIREVGHMGIIVKATNNQYNFIHSTSGRAHGVTITPLNSYYMGRFVKVIRVFER